MGRGGPGCAQEALKILADQPSKANLAPFRPLLRRYLRPAKDAGDADELSAPPASINVAT